MAVIAAMYRVLRTCRRPPTMWRGALDGAAVVGDWGDADEVAYGLGTDVAEFGKLADEGSRYLRAEAAHGLEALIDLGPLRVGGDASVEFVPDVLGRSR